MFVARYANVFEGPEEWRSIETGGGMTYGWEDGSTYVQYPPFFEGMTADARRHQRRGREAGRWLILGDSVTTDHISPAGAIKKDSPAGSYLTEHIRCGPVDFQFLRIEARQPPGHDARHLRQHPDSQRDGTRHRGRGDQATSPTVRSCRSMMPP